MRRQALDRPKDAPVGPDARLQGGHDLFLGPVAEARRLVRRQIGPDKDPEAGNLKADIGTTEVEIHVGLTKEVSWRVAIQCVGLNALSGKRREGAHAEALL